MPIAGGPLPGGVWPSTVPGFEHIPLPVPNFNAAHPTTDANEEAFNTFQTAQVTANRANLSKMQADDSLPESLRFLAGQCKFLGVSWDDTDRKMGSCLGNNITDTRQAEQLVLLDDEGDPVEGGEGPKILKHELDFAGSNFLDPRVVMSTDKFDLVVCDPDGSNKRTVTLKQALADPRKYWAFLGLEEGTDFSKIENVALKLKVCYVSEPPPGTAVEVMRSRFNYQTCDEKNPGNVVLNCSSLGSFLSTDRPGQTYLYNQFQDPADTKVKSYTTDITSTDRSVKNIGVETAEEAAAAAAAGKGTAVSIGCFLWGKTSSAVMDLSFSIVKKQPQPREGSAPSPGWNVGQNGFCMYRSLGAGGGGSGQQLCYRSLASDTPPEAEGKEARTSVGSFAEITPPLGNKKPVADGTTILATVVFFVTVKYGHAPSYETIVDSVKMLHEKWEQAKRAGTEMRTLHSQQAVDIGLTSTAPLTAETKQAVQQEMERRSKKPKPGMQALAPPTPSWQSFVVPPVFGPHAPDPDAEEEMFVVSSSLMNSSIPIGIPVTSDAMQVS